MSDSTAVSAGPKPDSNVHASGLVRFGVFEFDASSGELRRNGIVVRLQAQPARVLSHLLAHTDRVVTREELHEAIWGSSTFVDFERGLNVCIAQIRATLGDESSAPRYIRTIPRKGYEFICPVQKLTSEPEPAVSTRGSLRAHRLMIGALTALLVISAVVAGFFYARPHGKAAPLTIAVTRFDNETGDPQFDRFSDTLTDDVVARLTDSGAANLRIIGNSSLLRVPRAQLNLLQISSSLHAQFVIIGQVQRIGSQTRILAHLIRLPEQSHVWVVRLDEPGGDPASFESLAVNRISSEIAEKLANPSSLTALHNTASR